MIRQVKKALVDLVKNVTLLFPIIFLRSLYERSCAAEQLAQKQIKLAYQASKGSGEPRLDFADVGFRCYSQNDEDGILLYIFSVIGETNRRCVEICAGDGFQCNAANLLLNHGWEGLLVDGDRGNVRRGRKFFRWDLRTRRWQPTFVHAWVTRENINEIIEVNGFAGSIDLLSLDLDGNDYWIWEALTSVDPRVVVLECNDALGAERALTIPYSKDFVLGRGEVASGFWGASLAAFIKLAKQKNYRLVGSEKLGFNAFFMRNDVGVDAFPEIDPRDCLTHPRSRAGREPGGDIEYLEKWQQV